MTWKRRKKKKRSEYQKAKRLTDKWCSRYVRLKAAVSFDPVNMLGRCYTCGRVVDVIHKGDSGHFKSRGSGGSSGLYFDERAIQLQCKACNGFEGGRPAEYRKALVNDYGEEVVQELELKHRVNTYTLRDIIGLGLYFRDRVQEMCETYNIYPWW